MSGLWAVSACACGRARRDVRAEEKDVVDSVRLLLATGSGGEVGSDLLDRSWLRCVHRELVDTSWAACGCACGEVRRGEGSGEEEVSMATCLCLAMERDGMT